MAGAVSGAILSSESVNCLPNNEISNSSFAKFVKTNDTGTPSLISPVGINVCVASMSMDGTYTDTTAAASSVFKVIPL